MINPKGRYIHSRTMQHEVRNLMQTLFVSELVFPSNCIWIISPWITDIPIIDNRNNTFLCLEPEWGRNQIRFSQLIRKFLENGTTIRIASRPLQWSSDLVSKLKSEDSLWGHPNLYFEEVEELHEKGILGDDYYLAGSMNFTFNGITLNEESVHFHTDSQIVAENRLAFRDRWGS